jgi:CheY-like chemotaxis protein
MLLGDISPARFPVALASGSKRAAILLADDDPVLRCMCRGALESDGSTVIEAPDGEAVLGVIQEGSSRVDLVITELTLPGIAGREVAEVLSVFYPEMPVLGITADPANADRRLPTLLKPFSAEILIEAARLMRNRAIEMRTGAREQRVRARQARRYAAAMSARYTTPKGEVDHLAIAKALQQIRHRSSRRGSRATLLT